MAFVINQMRDDGNLEQHGGSGSGIKWLNARYVLKVENRIPACGIYGVVKFFKRIS